jgi:hypothetical protein
MEVESSTRLFGGRRALRDRVVHESRDLGATKVAWAPTSLAALALARAGTEDGIRRPLADPLDSPPFGTLSASTPHTTTLAQFGCRTLGDVRALPCEGISRRFGKDMLRAMDEAYGMRPETHAWLSVYAQWPAARTAASRYCPNCHRHRQRRQAAKLRTQTITTAGITRERRQRVNPILLQSMLSKRRRDAAILFAPRDTAPIATLVSSVILLGDRVPEGHVIEAVALPWFDIVRILSRKPARAHEIDSRKWEEIVAGAYSAAGFEEVILTKRSGDGGRDVIATKRGLFTIRVYDQVKAYKPSLLVTHNDVRAMLGVLDPSVSKGYVTTTSDFEPGVHNDPWLSQHYPARLELRNRAQLLAWLSDIRLQSSVRRSTAR